MNFCLKNWDKSSHIVKVLPVALLSYFFFLQIKTISTQRKVTKELCKHIFNTHHTYTDIETNLEILHTLPKGPKLNTTEQYEIYKHYNLASQAKMYTKYLNVKTKLHKTIANIYFNKECLKYKLTPTYAKIKIKDTN